LLSDPSRLCRAGQTPVSPDFQSAWLAMGGEFKELGGTPTPTRQDPRYRYVPNNTSDSRPTASATSHHQLQAWVVEAMKKEHTEVRPANTPNTRARHARAGVRASWGLAPSRSISVQTPREVT